MTSRSSLSAYSGAAALTTLAVLALAGGCTLNKEPLRSGWLAGGVYPQPPPPACTPVQPPGTPYEDLRRWPAPPSADARVDVDVDVPFLGRMTARARGAGTVTPRTTVSTRATRPIRVLDDRAAPIQVPGFVGAVDLRAYRRIAFVADTSGYMCADYQPCPESAWKFGPPAPALKAEGDQIDAAVAGLRPDQFFVVVGGSAWGAMRFQPVNPPGRALAGQFVRGQVCQGQRGVSNLFARALADAPDVIVLLTDGIPLSSGDFEYEKKYGGCGAYPDSLICYVQEGSEQVDLARLGSGKPIPPVIAVSVKRRRAQWLLNLAEMTGGVYVDGAP
jgi:hypothetical protein